MFLGDCLTDIGSCLTAAELAAAEQAQLFEQQLAARLYLQLSIEPAKQVVPWCPMTVRASIISIRSDGKRLLRELERLRLQFVVSTSHKRAVEYDEDAGFVLCQPSALSEDTMPVSTLPLSLGTVLGRPLAVGMRLACAGGVASMGDGCCVGVVAAGCAGSYGMLHEISFSPVTGRCYHQYPGHSPVMWASVMSPVETCDECDEAAAEIDAWVYVRADGGLCLFRSWRGDLQTSGILPRENLPDFVSEYHAAVLFMPKGLKAPTSAAVLHHGPSLPTGMSILESKTEFSGTWTVWQEGAEDLPGEAEVLN